MHTNQLLKRLASETPSAVWAGKALAKYLVADFDIISYFFSSDVRADQSFTEPHDRTDDLFLVTPGSLTFYRMTTKGLREQNGSVQVDSQRLEKSVVPLSHLANVHMAWESIRPFNGHAPDHDPELQLTIHLDIDMPPLGKEITLPYRKEEAKADPESVHHQIETFAEALLLEVHDDLQPIVALEDRTTDESSMEAARQEG